MLKIENSFRNFYRASFIASLSCSLLLCAHFFGRALISDESVGQWVFVPKSEGSYVSAEGFTHPDPSADASDIFPNDFKTYTDKGTWVFLRNPGVEIPKLTEPKLHQGINWGLLDCGFHGPKYESRALGCDRPGRLALFSLCAQHFKVKNLQEDVPRSQSSRGVIRSRSAGRTRTCASRPSRNALFLVEPPAHPNLPMVAASPFILTSSFELPFRKVTLTGGVQRSATATARWRTRPEGSAAEHACRPCSTTTGD